MKPIGAMINRRRLLALSGAAVAAGSAPGAVPLAEGSGADSEPFIILSCDGGGVRGLITALLLQSLDRPFLRKVSLFAGTSTGSIIALGLAAGLRIEEIVSLYKGMENCRTIFKPNPLFKDDFAEQEATENLLLYLGVERGSTFFKQLTEFLTPRIGERILKLVFPQYEYSGLEALLNESLPNLTLAELASQRRKYVVVPSFQVNHEGTDRPHAPWRSVLFHNLPDVRQGPDLSTTKLVDAAMSSAAAPVYFKPHAINEVGNFVDGGLVANNPCSAAIAAVLASSLSGQAGRVTTKSIIAVSIGTGNIVNNFPSDTTDSSSSPNRYYGLLGWLNPKASRKTPELPMIAAMYAGSSEVDDFVASALLRDSTYIRVNPFINPSSRRSRTWSLDDCEAIPEIVEQTRRYIDSRQWRRLADRINSL